MNRKITYSDKLKEFAIYVKKIYNPPIIFMQEALAGRGQKCLQLLKDLLPEYQVIPPAFDYFKHPQSLLAVTLIRKDILGDFTVKVIDNELPNRVNCVLATIEGEPYRLINVHMIQVANFQNQASWYIHERLRLHLRMWELLLKEAENHKAENVIIAGDFQERKTAPHISQLTNMGYMMAGTRHATVCNTFFTEDHIDHIMFSPNAYQLKQPVSIMTDNSEFGNWSDHVLVFAACVS